MTAIFVPVPFIRVGSSTLISVRDTVVGTVSAGATATINMPTNGASDVVVCILGNDQSGTVAPATPSGFTSIIDEASSSGNARAAYCVNPGASISYTNTHATRDMAYIFRTYSRVDTASVLSGTPTENGTGDGDPNPPSMTTSHNNAMVVACAVVSEITATGYSAGTGYTELTVTAAVDPDGSTQSCVVMMANKLVPTAGAENPGAFTNASVGTADTFAFTFALKPA